jgi:hypothetical protein
MSNLLQNTYTLLRFNIVIHQYQFLNFNKGETN